MSMRGVGSLCNGDHYSQSHSDSKSSLGASEMRHGLTEVNALRARIEISR